MEELGTKNEEGRRRGDRDVLPAELFVKAWLGSQGKTVGRRALRMGEGFLGLVSVQRSPFTRHVLS